MFSFLCFGLYHDNYEWVRLQWHTRGSYKDDLPTRTSGLAILQEDVKMLPGDVYG